MMVGVAYICGGRYGVVDYSPSAVRRQREQLVYILQYCLSDPLLPVKIHFLKVSQLPTIIFQLGNKYLSM